MHRSTILMLILSVALIGSVLSHDTCHATVIVSPVDSFNNTMGQYFAFSMAGAIDQSGLSSGFTSGVTNLTTYLGTNPTHAATTEPPNFWVSMVPTGSVDFDLGSTFTVTHLVLWQQDRWHNEQVKGFTVFTSNVSDFTSLTNVGSFTATEIGGGPAPAETFNLTPSTGRYVRLNITSSNSFTDIGELAFGVPEPSTLALATVAAFGLLAASTLRRRRPRKA